VNSLKTDIISYIRDATHILFYTCWNEDPFICVSTWWWSKEGATTCCEREKS